MQPSVNRENLGDLVQQFLQQGGEVKKLPETNTEPRRVVVRKAAAEAKAKKQKVRDPLGQPISLAERALLPEVQAGIEQGMTLLELIKWVGATRGSLLRIIAEYNLEVPSTASGKRATIRGGCSHLSDEQVLSLILTGIEAGKGLSTVCARAGICQDRGRFIYQAYKAKSRKL